MESTSTSQVGKTEANNILDTPATDLLALLTMRVGDVTRTAYERLKHDRAQMEQVSSKIVKLASEYNHYLDLQAQLSKHERSVEKVMALLGPGLLYPNPETMDEVEEQDKAKRLRDDLELWEAVEQYLRFVPEARVREIVEFLQVMDIPASRQSVEACIQARPKVFAVKKRKREKFVSLREKV